MSDEEVIHKEVQSKLTYVRYVIVDKDEAFGPSNADALQPLRLHTGIGNRFMDGFEDLLPSFDLAVGAWPCCANAACRSK